MPNASFTRYVGIDYSGAATSESSLKGLRVYLAELGTEPVEVPRPPSPRRYWSRREIAEWLAAVLAEDRRTIVGIDHGFSFPLEYFAAHGLAHDWPSFLDDFQAHWPTDRDIYVDFVRDGSHGNGAARAGDTRWRRLTERCAGSAKSVFHFDCQGSVAKSTHAGLPWLRYLRQRVGHRTHFWPFDGWATAAGSSVVVEVYPRLWSHDFPAQGRTADQHDAWSVAEWLRRADRSGVLQKSLDPALTPEQRAIAQIEGWILGVEPCTPGAVGRSRRPPPRDAATEYVDSGAMTQRVRYQDHVAARIDGRYGTYRVQASARGRVEGDCTCPSDERPCKHVRALRTTWETTPASFFDVAALLRSLSGVDQAELIAMIGRIIEARPQTLASFGVPGFEEPDLAGDS